jgi:hypothetical protein
MTSSAPGKRRPIVVLKTEGKTREQMKAEARRALADYLTTQPDDTEADS